MGNQRLQLGGESMPFWIRLLVLAFAVWWLAGCATALPTQTVNGIAIYQTDRATVEAYCYNKLSAEERAQPRVFGCFDRAANLIMVDKDFPEVLAHELRHAQGWEHRGPCHSSKQYPDGLTPAGKPCEWYRR